MEKRCTNCKYNSACTEYEYPCIDCVALSNWQPDVVEPKPEQKDILVFKFNMMFKDPDKNDKLLYMWTSKLKEMRETGIILLPNFIDFVGPVSNISEIELYNSEGEELCLEQKKL